MSCNDIGKSENLIYIRRTNGGSSTGGVIYSWDYHLMASMPTNDNVRYQKNKDEGNPSIQLHEISNNRYEDVICKSTHLAYLIGGFSRSAPIPVNGGKNEIEKLNETTNNACVLLFTSSSNFYRRLPECWPWSCRRWTREVTRKCNGEIETDYYYYQDPYGTKVEYGDFSDKKEFQPKQIPKLQLNFYNNAVEPDEGSAFQFDIETVTKDEYPDNCTSTPSNPVDIHLNKNYFNGHLYKEVLVIEKDEYSIDEEILKAYGCTDTDEKIKLGVEIFPILCNGICKLVIKFASLCYDSKTSSNYTIGIGTKKLVSPFWSCRINEGITLYKPTNQIYYLDHLPYETKDAITIEKATRDEFGNIEPKDTNIRFYVPDHFKVKNTVLTLQIVAISDLKNIFGQDIDQEYRNVKLTFNLIAPDGETSARIGYSSFDNSTLMLPDPAHQESFAYIRFNDEYGDTLPDNVANISDLGSGSMPIYESNQGYGNPIAWRDGTVIEPVTFGDTDPKLTIFSGIISKGDWTLQITNYSWYPDITLQTGILSLGKEFPGVSGVSTLSVQLNGADEQFSQSDLFNPSKPTYYTITGQDYTLNPVYDDPSSKDKKLIGHSRQNWNVCDKSRSETYFQMETNENIGKANKYINVQDSCCKKCKKLNENKEIVFFDDPYCYELDNECNGIGYGDLDREAGCG